MYFTLPISSNNRKFYNQFFKNEKDNSDVKVWQVCLGKEVWENIQNVWEHIQCLHKEVLRCMQTHSAFPKMAANTSNLSLKSVLLSLIPALIWRSQFSDIATS